MIRFLAAVDRWTLLEIDEDEAVVSLTQLHRQVFACDPKFDPEGDAVTGIHYPLDDGVRGMLVARSANADAVRGAIRILIARYDLDRVKLMARPPYGTGARQPDDYDWTPDIERPYDVEAATVWPFERSRPVRDTVIAESTTAPGYLHRIRRDPKWLWAALSPRVEEAFEFRSIQEATAWLAAHNDEPEAPWRLVFRSVALAEQDREEASTNQQLRG